MQIELVSEMSSVGSSNIQLFFDGISITLQATYFESDIPKSQVTATLSQQEVLQFYGLLEAVLSQNTTKDMIALPVQEIGIVFVENDRKTSDTTRVFDLRIEKFSQSKFIQLTGSASKFYQLKFYLQNVLNRLL